MSLDESLSLSEVEQWFLSQGPSVRSKLQQVVWSRMLAQARKVVGVADALERTTRRPAPSVHEDAESGCPDCGLTPKRSCEACLRHDAYARKRTPKHMPNEFLSDIKSQMEAKWGVKAP